MNGFFDNLEADLLAAARARQQQTTPLRRLLGGFSCRSDIQATAAGDRPRERRTFARYDRHRARTRIKLAKAGIPLGVGLAAVIAIIVGLNVGSSTPVAFAGWTATPTKASEAKALAALHVCTRVLKQDAEYSTRQQPRRIADAPWQPVVSDQRGPYTGLTAVAGDSALNCIVKGSTPIGGIDIGYGFTHLTGDKATGICSPATDQFPPTLSRSNSGAAALTVCRGSVGPAVHSVAILRRGSATVHATVANGFFFAWWPGKTPRTSAPGVLVMTHSTKGMTVLALHPFR